MLELRIERTWDGRTIGPDEHVTLRLAGDPAGLKLSLRAPFHDDTPPAAPAGPAWALWQHEVVELFVSTSGTTRYTEIELGPHGHHLVLKLAGQRRVIARELPLDYVAVLEGARWRGETIIPWSHLPEAPHSINAYAIHGQLLSDNYFSSPTTITSPHLDPASLVDRVPGSRNREALCRSATLR